VPVVRGEPGRVTVTVPVDFRTLPAGLELRDAAADGVRVQVAGSRFLVERLRPDQVGLHVDLRGAGPAVTTVDLGAGDVELPPGLRVTGIEPPRLTVALERRVVKTVPVTPVASPLPPGAGPAVWAVDPPSVAVVGPQSAVDRLKDVKTRPLDLTGLRGPDLPRTFAVELDLSPPSLRLAEGQPGRVRVTVRPGPQLGPPSPP
jgi:YbbR domain-containing protein